MGQVVMPNFNQPAQGIPTNQQPLYPVQSVVGAGGGTAGLVDRNKIINDSVQNALNQSNQIHQMHWAKQAHDEEQAKNKAVAQASGMPGATSATGDGHADFMSSVLQGLHSLGSGIANTFGGGKSAIPAPSAATAPPAGSVPQGPPAPSPAPVAAAPAPAAAPPAPGAPAPMQDGGPVTDPPIHKSSLGELLVQGAKDLGHAVLGDGAGARAANAAKDSVENTTSRAATQGYQDGGVIKNEGVTPAFMHPTVLAFENGGAIPAMGVVAGGTNGVQGFEDGGQIPADPGMVAAAQGPASPDAQSQLVHVIDKLHQDMHDHSLGDDDKPNNSQAIPAGGPAPSAPGSGAPPPGGPPPAQGAPPPAAGAPPAPPSPQVAATAQAVQSVATDPTAQSGKITTTPGAEGKPHSITTDKWNEWDQNIDHAVALAAQAGHDPGQVRSALEANRNAFVQGHVLRYLSAANVALLNGDQKNVEKAIRNAYYYMPDGQDLQVQKDKDGNLMYQDPVNPTVGGPDGKQVPNMLKVDAAHIQLLGQAMLDPQNVQQTIMEIRSSQAVQQLKQAQAHAAGVTAEGNFRKGTGIMLEGQSHAALVNSQNYKNLAEGDAVRIRATALANHLNNTVRQNKIDPQLIKGAQDASQAFEDAAQGQKTTVQGDPMTNPNVGKTTRDPTKSTLPKATPEDITQGKSIAGDIFMGSGGSMSPARAADLARLAVQAKRSNSPKPGPNGKVASSPDFMTDPKTGDTHVWNKALKKWEAFRLPLTSSNDAASGNLGVTSDDLDDVAKAELASNSSGGQGAIPTSSSQMNGAKAEGDMQDQEFPEEG